MKLLLLQDVRKLGYLGDVVDVKPGYARNYLVPQGLATEPTEENIAAIAEERKRAAAERAQREKEFQRLADSLADVSVTIEAAANEEGHLYGSVTQKHIAQALEEQGYKILPNQISLDAPIRQIDNRPVKVEFTDEITTEVKVWVVRAGGAHVESAEPAQPTESGFEPTSDVGDELESPEASER